MTPLKTLLAEELDQRYRNAQVSTSHSYGDFHEKYLHLSSLKCAHVFPASRDLSMEEEGLGCNLWPSTRFFGDPRRTRKVYHDLSRSMDYLRVIILGSGAYGNQADVYPPDWQRAFPGRITKNCRG
ncbi:hypothetical protein EDD85DRAFT_957376 [Armillaria nabsnona]|nr:hypothetical protein EDD85DRAFT_957376 [Armillaria nabsnona]